MKKIAKILTAVAAVCLIAAVGFIGDTNLRIAHIEVASPQSEDTGRFIEVAGQRLYVSTMGSAATDPTGAPLLLVHGFIPAGHLAWLPWAGSLAVQRSLILPDLLGFGYSARAIGPPEAFSLKARAASLASILDTLGVPQVDVVGASYGGAVAAQFALDYPARVRRLVFMDAAIFPQNNSLALMSLPLGIGRALTWHTVGGGPYGYIARNCPSKPADCVWLRATRVSGTTDALQAMLAARSKATDESALPSEG